MRLVMTLCVKNDADLLATNIEYHLAQGVDYFIVTENGSQDGADQLIKKYVKMGRMRIIYNSSPIYQQDRWVTHMARIAYTKFGADWVINSDSDEFWMPKEGTLKSTLMAIPKEYGSILSLIYNFVARPPSQKRFYDEMIYAKLDLKNVGKTCHRGHAEISVGFGNHFVAAKDLGENLNESPIDVLHFPLRSYEQFATKVANGAKGLALNAKLHKDVGYHWRDYYQLYQEGKLADYFDNNTLKDNDIKKALTEDGYIIDERLRSFMNRFYEQYTDEAAIVAAFTNDNKHIVHRPYDSPLERLNNLIQRYWPK